MNAARSRSAQAEVPCGRAQRPTRSRSVTTTCTGSSGTQRSLVEPQDQHPRGQPLRPRCSQTRRRTMKGPSRSTAARVAFVAVRRLRYHRTGFSGRMTSVPSATRPPASSMGRPARSLEDELTEAFIDGYHVAGKEVGYWGRRFLQAVRGNGGLATAKRMLLPRNEGQRKGLDALLEANRPELTVEAIVLQPRFQGLFTAAELATAKDRLGEYGKIIATLASKRDRLYPEELKPGLKYAEGAKKQVRVNAYERNPRARAACLKHHGYDCVVCGFNFESRYGPLGRQFIHVHHLKPLALTDGEYRLDAVADLRPVCPNCHAMLHRGAEVLSIEELRAKLVATAGRSADTPDAPRLPPTASARG